MTSWPTICPLPLRSGQIQVHDTQGFFAPLLHHAWWKLRSDEHTESGDLAAAGTPDAVIEGIKSPYDPIGDRSIVAIHLRDASVFSRSWIHSCRCNSPAIFPARLRFCTGTQFQSFRIGSEVYHVGVLPWWTRLSLWITEVSLAGRRRGHSSGVFACYLDKAMAAQQSQGPLEDD